MKKSELRSIQRLERAEACLATTNAFIARLGVRRQKLEAEIARRRARHADSTNAEAAHPVSVQ